jgi:hypothetical protein
VTTSKWVVPFSWWLLFILISKFKWMNF